MINKRKIMYKKLFKDKNGPKLMIMNNYRVVLTRALFIFFPFIGTANGIHGTEFILSILIGVVLAISQFARIWFLQILGTTILFVFGALELLWGLFINQDALILGGFSILIGFFSVHDIRKYFNKS
ncbi:hypothetical protein [Methanobacterium petrolearium]|uniref:hypothetical protein n=1 Tax=Methanobacterium petrolearium TaxID=710190 RepID=UPI001AE891D7|nr:hypothetical protein [Methanobacterium petrolearium]MBP1946054.1 hypothetical protein [Methanobacterium petrolearium]